jgi:hypothetical protein
MFELGSKVIVNGSWDEKVFKDTEAYIFRLGDAYEDSTILLYMPSWVEEGFGHGQAWEEWDNDQSIFEFEPDESSGSWNVPKEWLTNGNIILVENPSEILGPHWKVIKKINQMKQRRKELGYVF